MSYAYRMRPLLTSDKRSTTFYVDTKLTVYDDLGENPGGKCKSIQLRKVGKLQSDGTIKLNPKYAAKYRHRLKQFDPQNSGCCDGGERQCANFCEDKEACAVEEKEFYQHRVGKPCFSYKRAAE